jgi:hypothetical protein
MCEMKIIFYSSHNGDVSSATAAKAVVEWHKASVKKKGNNKK